MAAQELSPDSTLNVFDNNEVNLRPSLMPPFVPGIGKQANSLQGGQQT
jgi:hypothetical protein